MQTITFEVTPEIAEAYQFASLEEREQIQQIVSLLLKKEKENDIDFLRKIMDEISDRATARGLTPEILEAIINEP
ncbi:MAG: hypothetical protein HEP80_10780 [Dolichospermum sp. UKL201]|jgi:hypothetical protein|nr:hypothetical protein [Dolichospermum sp. DET66]MBS3030920.1 hypothetical protein [Dolichospermum sp. DET67]MBS3036130.1 hypothetical protein [Dolichospermum sp. DET50]QSV54288.1 MAG: hypothetical protein HEP80_10780 [Dolichospermum sp. UKL201]QSX68206.1 MAG: hypothetical protein EZY12_00310 [Dolichospermum sp. DET69]